ncbi:MAG: glycerate kinase [Sulfurospirillaceae bacterium]|nr:glycerate kinase [Sulfurospirillaceae bacterium]
MNVLIAIDSFKGSLSTNEASDAIAEGIGEVSEQFVVKQVPISDGGEGTFEILLHELKGEEIKVRVKDPLFNEITAKYGILEDGTAILEMASAAGLPLVEDKLRNPMNTTTYGVGQMIEDALQKGCRKFIIGIGGSATNDGGIGMLRALGFRFFDHHDKELNPIGRSLCEIEKIDTNEVNPKLKACEFIIACDVDNPFYGPNGAAFVFGKQKGASEKEIIALDKGLEHFSNVIKRDLGVDVSSLKGAGAAGGLGGAFKAFLDAKLEPGTKIIFEKLDVENKIKWADIIITGEGKLDFQTAMGKAPVGISRLAKKYDKIVIALSGSLTDDAYACHDQGITAMFSIINMPMSLERAMDKENAKKNMKHSVAEIFRLIKALR